MASRPVPFSLDLDLDLDLARQVRRGCRLDRAKAVVVTNWHDLFKYTHMGRTITAALTAVRPPAVREFVYNTFLLYTRSSRKWRFLGSTDARNGLRVLTNGLPTAVPVVLVCDFSSHRQCCATAGNPVARERRSFPLNREQKNEQHFSAVCNICIVCRHVCLL